MKRIEVNEATAPRREYVAQLSSGLIMLTSGRRVVAVLLLIEEGDLESISRPRARVSKRPAKRLAGEARAPRRQSTRRGAEARSNVSDRLQTRVQPVEGGWRTWLSVDERERLAASNLASLCAGDLAKLWARKAVALGFPHADASVLD
jgi:hypothetical protein